MESITVKMSASQTSSSWTFTIDDLGFTLEEWHAATEEEKARAIENAIDSLPEQPYWYADGYNENF